MSDYELVVIFHPELSEEKVDESLEKVSSIIKNRNGEITSQDKWGKRRFAYLVKKQREGNYVIILFKSEPQGISELNKMLLVEEGILRFLLVKKEHIKSRKKKVVEKKEEKTAEAQKPV